MATSSKLVVMISSRNNDPFPADGKPLTATREALKQELEALELFGKAPFEVWINELEPAASVAQEVWDRCLEEVRDCDIMIAITNGNAGWVKAGDGGIGICHAEVMEAYRFAPGKLRVISIGSIAGRTAEEKRRNKAFQDYLGQMSPFGRPAHTVEELKARVKDALRDAVIRLAQSGVVEAGRGRYYKGQALDWTRLDFKARKAAMEAALREALLSRPGAEDLDGRIALVLDASPILMVAHAIPAALTVAAAREMVGQPFLRDHELVPLLPRKGGGPFHVIACHKSASEAQATALLGFPDATVVSGPFGVYVADNVQKVQFAFIVNCRDISTTAHGVQRFFDWLVETGEAKLVARRGRSRAKIVAAIAGEAGG
jgi:hypothetical protein